MTCPNNLKKISGKAILERCMGVFERNGSIDEITVLVHREFFDFWKKSYPKHCETNEQQQ
jgi:2-C-methyl-D-erythritol 4-phosphate cytidylyltransferase